MRRAGFVLVGGKSERMGRDKALLPWEGTTLGQAVAARVEAAAGSVTLIGDPKRYGGLGYPVRSDLHPGNGPLGGVETALSVSTAEWNLIVACDMPGLPVEFLARLVNAAEKSGASCLAAAGPGGRPEPLCAVWNRRCLAAVSRALAHGERKMGAMLEAVEAAFLQAETAWLENLNTAEQWQRHAASPREQKVKTG